jgi:hypothetical protein
MSKRLISIKLRQWCVHILHITFELREWKFFLTKIVDKH